MDWSSNAFSLLVRPLVFVAFFGLVAVIGAWIRRLIPEGRAKQFLTRPVNFHPRTEGERRSWFPLLVWVGLALLIWVPLIWWASRL